MAKIARKIKIYFASEKDKSKKIGEKFLSHPPPSRTNFNFRRRKFFLILILNFISRWVGLDEKIQLYGLKFFPIKSN